MALYKNNQNLLRISSPVKEAPLLTVKEAGWAPEPVWTSWRRETSCPCPESNPSCPPLCPSRRHGYGSYKNWLYSTSHLFYTWFQSSIASFMRGCSYQPRPPAIRVVLRERSSLGNGSPERTPRKTPADCYLLAAAVERRKILTLPASNSDSSAVQPVASRYTDCAIVINIVNVLIKAVRNREDYSERQYAKNVCGNCVYSWIDCTFPILLFYALFDDY
jgi:hypothetical protein